MKDDLRDLLRGSASPTEARNLLREALQARLLASLQRAGAMVPLAFQGGTALRFLYSIRRYSEDLDFALERPERGYDFRSWLQRLKSDWSSGSLTPETWRLPVAAKIRDLDWDRVTADVRPFLEKAGEIDLVTRENTLKLLEL